MNTRIRKLIGSFQEYHIDAFLVTKDINIQYLTRFPACESWMLVSPQGSFYITDFRYVLEAKEGLKGVKIYPYAKSIYSAVAELAGRLKFKKIGFDSRHLNVSQYENFKKSVAHLKFVKADHLVERLREIKDADEIQKIRQALKIHGQALRFLKKIIKPGVSEQGVLRQLEDFVRERGVGFSFSPIIASGPNSCYPHAKVTGRKMRLNESVLVDIGIDVGGYKSDLTRIFFLGRIPEPVERAYTYVRRAQQEAIQKIRAGIAASEVDKAARQYLKTQKLDKFFGHALGHGVGLEIHESPRLSQTDPAILKEGMVVTVEPAVYIPRQFGIRIEDMVLVKKKNCEVLSANIDY